MYYDLMPYPLGTLAIAADDAGLRHIEFQEGDRALAIPDHWQHRPNHPLLLETKTQLGAYFAGKRTHFDLPLAPRGSAFQKEVWEALCRIPHGQVVSYGELARRLERPKASRAVGAANGRNPIAIVVPCHRVIGSSGKLTGYAGGLPIKRWLLDLEGHRSGDPAR